MRHEVVRASTPVGSPTVGGHFFPPGAGIAGGLERLKFPSYSGSLSDYPTWKDDWEKLVHGKLEEAIELIQLRASVPKLVKVELKNARTLVAAWTFLDAEFGDTTRLAAERVAYLHAFQPSARSDAEKFKELHAVWREVYTDLDKVNAAGNLDNALAIEGFIKKLPLKSREAYVRFEGEADLRGVQAAEAVNRFMTAERTRMRKLERFTEP